MKQAVLAFPARRRRVNQVVILHALSLSRKPSLTRSSRSLRITRSGLSVAAAILLGVAIIWTALHGIILGSTLAMERVLPALCGLGFLGILAVIIRQLATLTEKGGEL